MTRIRGIHIEIDGNTTGLNRALNEVNNNTRKTQSELKKVEKALKFNPGNTELLAQKQQLLAKEVSNTSTKLNALRQAQAQVEQQFRNGEIGEEQYRAFQRELIETESRLRHFEDELARSQSRMRQMGQSMQEVGANIKKVGDGMQNVGRQLTTAVTLPIIGLGAAAAKVGMDFEAGMSKVGAISGATAADMEKLSAKAKEMGSQTKFSATEASDAFSYMALAGWGADQMIAGIGGTLALAAASGEDLAQTTDIVTDGMSMFAMKADEAGRFADVLAAASANTNTDVKGLGEALKYAGASANAAGLDIEQTSAFIGMLANNGIKGSSAGTTMNAVLRDLGKSAKDGKIQLGDMSVAVYDAEGNMRSLSDIMADVETATKGMNDEARNDALRANFGDEALRGVNIALASGADEIKRLEGIMYSAKGTAEKMAAVMSDNLKGRLTELGSALEGIGIKIYENMQPALEKAVELAQKLADKFMALSPEMQNTIVVIAAVAAAIGPVILVLGMFISAIGTIVSAIGSMMVAFSAGGAAVSALSTAFTVVTGPIGLAIAAIAAVGLAVAAVVEHMSGPAVEEVDRFGGSIEGLSEKTQKAADDFYTMSDDVGLAVMDMSMRSQIVTDEMASGLIDKFKTMNDQIVEGLNKNHTERLASMQEFFVNSSVLNDAEEAKIIAKEQERHDADLTRRKIQQDKIVSILNKAKEEKRNITEQEKDEINRIQEEMNVEAVKILTDSEVEQKVIMERLKQSSTDITAQQAVEVVKNSAKQRDESIKNAEEQYDKSVAEIIRMRDETGVITEEQATKMIAEAERQKTESVKRAKDMHQDVVSEAQAQAKNHIDKVNWETGEVLSKWEVFKGNVSRKWQQISTDAKSKWEEIKKNIVNSATNTVTDTGAKWEELKRTTSTKWESIKTEMKKKMEEASKNVTSIVGKMPGKVGEKASKMVSAGADLIGGLIKGIVNKGEEAVNAIAGVVDGVINKAKSLLEIASPSKVFTQFGGWISEGLANGITKSADLVVTSTKNLINDGILTPVKDLSQEILKEFDLNLNQGMIAAQQAAGVKLAGVVTDNHLRVRTALALAQGQERGLRRDAQEVLQRDEDEHARRMKQLWATYEHEQKAGLNTTTKEYIEYVDRMAQERFKDVRNQLEAGTIGLEATKRYYDQAIAAGKEYIAEQKSQNAITLREELAFWEDMMAYMMPASESYQEVLVMHQASVKAIRDDLEKKNKEHVDKMLAIDKELADETAKLSKEYDDAYNSRIQTLTGFAKTFDEFKAKTEITGQQLMDNLQSQVTALDDYGAVWGELSGRIKDANLLDELKKLGPASLGELQALNSLTDEQLDQYVAMYGDKFDKASAIAAEELQPLRDNIDEQIAIAEASAIEKLDNLNKQWQMSITGIVDDTATNLDSLEQVGRDAAQGLHDGLASMQSTLVARATAIADSIKAAMQTALDIHSPSRVMRGFGVNIGEGLVLGMGDMLDSVAKASARLSSAVVGAQTAMQYSEMSSMGAMTNAYSNTSTIDNSKTFAPTINLNGQGNVMDAERALRRMAFAF